MESAGTRDLASLAGEAFIYGFPLVFDLEQVDPGMSIRAAAHRSSGLIAAFGWRSPWSEHEEARRF